MSKMDNLIVLDINGVLCTKLSKRVPDNQLSDDIIRCRSYDVKIRPYAKEFLHHMYSNYTIGFFSSTTETNAKAIMEHILTHDQLHATLFFWYRDKTRTDTHSSGSYATIKLVSDVRLQYNNYKRIIIIDDSSEKLRYNSPEETIVCDKYLGENNDKTLLLMIENVENKITEQYKNVML